LKTVIPATVSRVRISPSPLWTYTARFLFC